MKLLSGNQRPDLLTSLMKMSLLVSSAAPATQPASLQILFKRPAPAPAFELATQTSALCSLFGKVQNPLRLPRKTAAELQKVVRDRQVFNASDFEMASCHSRMHFSTSQLPKMVRTCCASPFSLRNVLRHNDVHFFDSSTSNSGLNVWCG